MGWGSARGVVRDPFGEVCDEVGPKLARSKQGERFSTSASISASQRQ